MFPVSSKEVITSLSVFGTLITLVETTLGFPSKILVYPTTVEFVDIHSNIYFLLVLNKNNLSFTNDNA